MSKAKPTETAYNPGANTNARTTDGAMAVS